MRVCLYSYKHVLSLCIQTTLILQICFVCVHTHVYARIHVMVCVHVCYLEAWEFFRVKDLLYMYVPVYMYTHIYVYLSHISGYMDSCTDVHCLAFTYMDFLLSKVRDYLCVCAHMFTQDHTDTRAYMYK